MRKENRNHEWNHWSSFFLWFLTPSSRFVRAVVFFSFRDIKSIHFISDTKRLIARNPPIAFNRRSGEKDEKKEEYTVPFFIWALAFVSKQFVLLSFHAIVFMPPGVPIDCRISVRYVLCLWFLTENTAISEQHTHTKKISMREMMIFENAPWA